MKYYSQIGQDEYLNEHVFKNLRNGVFVEVGASDGLTHSNTAFFEKSLGWTGLCVEPVKQRYDELVVNRNCICVNAAIHVEEREMELTVAEYGKERTTGLSGLTDEYGQHKYRVVNDIRRTNGNLYTQIVKTIPLQKLLDKHNLLKIDFCSIDVEGCEMKVLQSIDFSKTAIRSFLLENNYGDMTIQNYLSNYGYRLLKKLKWDDVYINDKSI